MKKVYCVECGLEMVEQNRFVWKYNSNTGKPEVLARYRCPKRRWWNIFSWTHDDLLCSLRREE